MRKDCRGLEGYDVELSMNFHGFAMLLEIYQQGNDLMIPPVPAGCCNPTGLNLASGVEALSTSALFQELSVKSFVFHMHPYVSDP